MSETGGPGRVCIVGVGASAGGLEAIREMLASASAESNLAYVVIQHLDPNHESLLAELLGRQTSLKVLQASGGEAVEAGHVYIIPPGHGLSIHEGKLQLTDFAQPRGLRRPIDDFFESLALDQGRFAACVILSGTGADGSQGLRAIKEYGGLCIAQDPGTARYDGMPLSATGTGLVDFVRAPDQIVDCIVQFYAHAAVTSDDDGLGRTIAESIDDICAVLVREVGHDFSGYKQSTLVRRIQRRIQVLNLPDATAYIKRLKSDRGECEMLFRELLINVTRFFRDSDHFDTLRKRVVEPLVREVVDSGRDDEIRVWIPGCSSGEEVYSIAMLFAEEVRQQRRSILIQIFATDIDEQMLRIARQGVYPLAALADIPEEMRDSYTIARDGSFQITARLRDMIRFSVHSVIKDPPFSNIDLVSCRNLLIYLGDKLQAQALPIFHYAIRPRGILFLGPSETIGRFEDLFETVDQRARLFRRNEGRPEYPVGLRGTPSTERGGERRSEARSEPARVDWQRRAATDKILQSYAAPTMLVTKSGEILATTGQLGKYMETDLSPGGSRYASSAARPGLREAVSALIRRGSETRRRTVVSDLTARSEFGTQTLDLIGEPLTDGTILLVFRDRDRFAASEDEDIETLEPSDTHVQGLEEELRATRARLSNTVEELETANEELKSSNEEMMSMNEELQSTNEELATVNDELKSKVDQLSVANADLQNFFSSTALPLVVVDHNLNIRNFTDPVLTIYPFRSSDRGRPLAEMRSVLRNSDEVIEAVRKVIETGETEHLRVDEPSDGRHWSLLITPYQTRDGRNDGATLVFTDLTSLVEMQEELEIEGQRLRLALKVAGLGVWEYDRASRTLTLDETGARMLGTTELTPSLDEVLSLISPEDRETFETAIDATATGDGAIDVSYRVPGADEMVRSLQTVGRRIGSRRARRLLGVTFDITAEQEAARIRELMLREMNHRVKNLFSIITGMLRMVGRQAKSVPEVVSGVEHRVAALARSHDMTQRRGRGQAVTLHDAVTAALMPYWDDTRIEIDGPEVPVKEQELTALSLLFHEWATNSAKYGVLGDVPGKLQVTWASSGDEVKLSWNENYAEALEEETEEQDGFGSTLIQLSAAQLHGRVEVDQQRDHRTSRVVYRRSG